jgi:kumamolisin
VTHQFELHHYIRRPQAQTRSLTAKQVAQAYNFPPNVTGKGFTAGIIELGGGFGPADLDAYFGDKRIGLPVPNVTSVSVAGGQNASDGPNGADGEVLLDIEVLGTVAPGANIRVYFAPNTDAGFLAAIEQAAAECDVVSISWGQAENQWNQNVILNQYAPAFKAAHDKGVLIFAAAGDSGADDGTGAPVTDYPASDPNVVGCGGTRLSLNADGTRQSEITWNDNSISSATGGGLSHTFDGRQVPDIAGNADPYTGYQVYVDGSWYVIGGTSAVSPLMAGLALLLSEALGQRVGKILDLVKLVAANPTTCYDVTVGDNGAFRAGPGRDQVTGDGVPDGGRVLAAYEALGTPTPPPVESLDQQLADEAEPWVQKRRSGDNNELKKRLVVWLKGKGFIQ